MASAAAGSLSLLLFDHKSCNTDAENVGPLLELQAELHTSRHSVTSMRSQVAKLEIALQESKLTENVLRGRVRTRARAAAAIHKAMLGDLLALQAQVRYFEQQNASHGHHSPLVGGVLVSSPPLGQPNEFVSYMKLGKVLDDDAAIGGLVDDANLLPDDVVVTQRILFEEETRKVRQRLDEQRARIRLVCDDRVAATEAKMRRMRQQFHEACKIQRECESRISAAQVEAELRVAAEIEAAAQATTEYIQKFKDEAEATIDHLSVKVADVSMLLETAQAENEVLASRLERMQHTKKAIAAKQVEELERNLDVLYHQLLGKEEEVGAAKRQLREAQAATETATQRADLLQEELRRRTNLMDDLEDRMHTLKVERDGAAAAAKEEIERMRSGIEAEVQRRVAETAPPFDPEALERAEEQIQELRAHCREQDEDIRSLKARLAEAQSAKKEQTIANLAAMEALEKELQDERTRLSEARAQVEALERSVVLAENRSGAGAPSAAKDAVAPQPASSQNVSPEEACRTGGETTTGSTAAAADYLRGVYEVVEPCVAGGDFRTVLHGLGGFEATLDALLVNAGAHDKGRRMLDDAVQSLFRVEHRIRTTSRLLSSALLRLSTNSNSVHSTGVGGSAGSAGGLAASMLMANSALQGDATAVSAATPKLPPCSSSVVKDFAAAAARISGDVAKKQTAAWCKAKASRQASLADFLPATSQAVVTAEDSRVGTDDNVAGNQSAKPTGKRSPTTASAVGTTPTKQPQPSSTTKQSVAASSNATGPSPLDSPQPSVGMPLSVTSSSLSGETALGLGPPLISFYDGDLAQLQSSQVAIARRATGGTSTNRSRRDSCVQTEEVDCRAPLASSVLGGSVDKMPISHEGPLKESSTERPPHGSPVHSAELKDMDADGWPSFQVATPTTREDEHLLQEGMVANAAADPWRKPIHESPTVDGDPPEPPPQQKQQQQQPRMTVEECFRSSMEKGDARHVETLVRLLQMLPAKERALFHGQSTSAGLLAPPAANTSKDARPSSRPATAGSASRPSAASAVAALSPTRGTDAAVLSSTSALDVPSAEVVAPGAEAIGALLHSVQPAVTAFCQTLTEHVVMGRNVGVWCRRVLSAIISVMNTSPFSEGEAGRDDELLLRALRNARELDGGSSDAPVGQVGMKWLSVVEWALRSSLRTVAETQRDLQWQLDANVRSRAAASGLRDAALNGGAGASSALRPRSAMTSSKGSGVALLRTTPTILEDNGSQLLRGGPRPTPARAQRPTSSQAVRASTGGQMPTPATAQVTANDSSTLNTTWSSAADRIAAYQAKLNEGAARPSSATIGTLPPTSDVKQRYRHGRADVAPSGHLLPRQFNAAIDVTVRHALDTVEAGAVVARETPSAALFLASDGGGTKSSAQHAILGVRLQQPTSQQSKEQPSVSLSQESHVVVAATDRPSSPEEAMWNPENHLFTDFVLQRHSEKQREVLRETIRCGSAPLHRSGVGARGSAASDIPLSEQQPSRIVYRGDAASDRHNPALGPMRPGKVLVQSKDGRSALRKATAPTYDGTGTNDGPAPSAPRTGLLHTHAAAKAPAVSGTAPESSGPDGARLDEEDRNSAADESAPQSLRFPQKLKSAVARGASSSAALSTIRVPKNSTQRRVAPPASVFQWQRLTSPSGGGGERRTSEPEAWLTGIGQGLSQTEWPATALDSFGGAVDDTTGDERLAGISTVGVPSPSFSLM